ncbi:Nif3-like dinuclear metal center hexameric protein [Candidatus Dependentiae bacterium]|nr:Nif3-like dinuclear metal center hexameric protein [Candidatus Dependentiae bacterium]
MNLKQLEKYLNDYLRVKEISDSSQNGLQVEMKGPVNRIGLAVDASLETFRKAKKKNVNLILVHHGLFWGQPIEITKLFYKRISFLIKNNIGLYASHLPLDMHPEVGNNAQIAEKLNLSNLKFFADYHGSDIGILGNLPKTLTYRSFIKNLKKVFKTDFKILHFGKAKVKKIGIISGGGGSFVEAAAQIGVDVYLTGEISHSSYHSIKEYGLNCVFGGHYFTETFGVKALGKHLKKKFNLTTIFLDSPTGM